MLYTGGTILRQEVKIFAVVQKLKKNKKFFKPLWKQLFTK